MEQNVREVGRDELFDFMQHLQCAKLFFKSTNVVMLKYEHHIDAQPIIDHLSHKKKQQKKKQKKEEKLNKTKEKERKIISTL